MGEVTAPEAADERPLILVTSDDGIESPGLRAAVGAVLELGDVLISAPSGEQSGSGRSTPATNDCAVREIDYSVGGRRIAAYSVHGSPAQAVLYALVELAPRKPNLCLSGINFGENVGSGITASGTVGAAMEAADADVPSLAVSLETESKYHLNHPDEVDFRAAVHFAKHFAACLLTTPMPAGVDLLKIDIPADATPETHWRIVHLSRQRYFRVTSSGRLPLAEKGRLLYDVFVDYETLEPDSDIHALVVDRVVAVTPLTLDLTSRVPFAELATRLC